VVEEGGKSICSPQMTTRRTDFGI